jgi:hypothetical protein
MEMMVWESRNLYAIVTVGAGALMMSTGLFIVKEMTEMLKSCNAKDTMTIDGFVRMSF